MWYCDEIIKISAQFFSYFWLEKSGSALSAGARYPWHLTLESFFLCKRAKTCNEIQLTCIEFLGFPVQLTRTQQGKAEWWRGWWNRPPWFIHIEEALKQGGHFRESVAGVCDFDILSNYCQCPQLDFEIQSRSIRTPAPDIGIPAFNVVLVHLSAEEELELLLLQQVSFELKHRFRADNKMCWGRLPSTVSDLHTAEDIGGNPKDF